MEFHKNYTKKIKRSQFRGTPRDNIFKNSYNIFVEQRYETP